MKVHLCAAAAILVTAVASPAAAQFAPPRDPVGRPAIRSLPLVLGAPVVLSLSAAFDAWHPRSTLAKCNELASGSVLGGFTMARWPGIRLTPRLSLFGVSLLGCVTDDGVAGGVGYPLPLYGRLSLRGSATVYVMPQVAEQSTLVKARARLDLDVHISNARSLHMGVDAVQILKTALPSRGGSKANSISLGGAF